MGRQCVCGAWAPETRAPHVASQPARPGPSIPCATTSPRQPSRAPWALASSWPGRLACSIRWPAPGPLTAAPRTPLPVPPLPALLGTCCPPSHPPPSFPCASFFCRSLKPPSFITLWTGSRYRTALTLCGASAGAGGRALAPGKVWALTQWGRCPGTPPKAGQSPESTGCSSPDSLKCCPWRHRCTQPTGVKGQCSLVSEQGPLLGTLLAAVGPVHSALAETRPSAARSSWVQGPVPRVPGEKGLGGAAQTRDLAHPHLCCPCFLLS